MAEGSAIHGPNKSRTVLGDVTNCLAKRGFSEKEKSLIGENDSKQKATQKRVRVSFHPCSEVNSLKGNVISSISKVPREPKAPDFGKNSLVSKSPLDVESYLWNGNGSHFSSNANTADSTKFLFGSAGFQNLGTSVGDANFQGSSKLSIDKDLVDDFRKIDYHGVISESKKVKLASINCNDSNLADFQQTAAAESISDKLNIFGNLESSKKNLLSAIPKTDQEQNCSNPTYIVDGIAVDDTVNGLGKFNAQDKRELVDDFTAETSRTESGTDGNFFSNVNTFDADAECARSDINGYQNDGCDHNPDNMIVSQSGSIDYTILPESQESRAFGIEGFSETKKGDQSVCLNGGIDTIKTCSCSFCTKAAFIWLDLNYQDIKARVSGIKKSQKEASILAEEIFLNKATERQHIESLTRVSSLESDLKHQWRSLFLHMGNAWEEEGNELEASLLLLKDLKEKCKKDSINSAMPSSNS